MSGASSLTAPQQAHPTLQKGAKVLQKEHIFYFPHASAEFWEHLSEMMHHLHHFNHFLFRINKLSVVQVVVHQWCISGASVVQLEGIFLTCTTLKCLILQVKDLVVQVVHHKRLVSHCSFRGTRITFLCYDDIKNILLLVIFSLLLSVKSHRGLKQNSSEFLDRNVLRGSKNRRKLAELQTERRVICYQRCVQWGLSHWIISRLQQIRYLVSCLPPYKTSVWFGRFFSPLHSINWSKIQGVFLKIVSVGCGCFFVVGFRKVGGAGEYEN